MRPMLILLLLFLASACDCTDNNTVRIGIDELTERQQQWQGNQLQNYQLRYSRQCFCPASITEITVEQGQITAAVEKNEQEQIIVTASAEQLQNYWDVDDFFSEISRLDRDGVSKLEVSYDSSLGYPTTIAIDPNGQQCSCAGGCTETSDDEYQYQLSLTLLP